MKATRAKHDLLRVCVLSCFVFLFTCTCTCGAAAAARKSASNQRALTRSRRSHKGARSHGHPHGHEHEHRRPLTDEQKADQNLQFMLSLYRSAAEPDGRPKQHRKFGSNTVRLLRPSAASVRHLPASRDHHYRFTVQYNLDTVPSEQLIRASFIHLRSSTSSSSSSSSSTPPRCRAQITSLGKASLVTLEPHERWTETDITAHVQRGRARGRLTLEARYWCREEPRPAEEEEEEEQEEGGGDLSGWWFRKRQRREPHLEAPSLLLYLEEEREAKDWIGDLLAPDGDNVTRRRLGPWRPPLLRRRRSKDLPLDVLKNAAASSSFSTSPWSSIISSIPDTKRKTAAPKDRCKLHSFRLSVDELGWGDYFIEPRVYNPRFCQGDCPRVLTYGFHSPNHAIIQTALNELGVGDVPPPSCVPYKYMSMSVLLVHKKKVEYRELEDMVAKSCTCR